MITLHIATTNPGKLRDFAQASADQAEILPLPNLHQIPEPEETAHTFAGNAQIKAQAYSQASPGLYVLADDSGLEVDALQGAPGVRSARFAEDHNHPIITTKDQANNQTLLSQLAGQQSPARYRCALALAYNGAILATAEGTVEGQILTSPRGTAGFGYDPLFLIPTVNQTMAEIDPATRLTLSHRGRALTQLLTQLHKIAQTVR